MIYFKTLAIVFLKNRLQGYYISGVNHLYIDLF